MTASYEPLVEQRALPGSTEIFNCRMCGMELVLREQLDETCPNSILEAKHDAVDRAGEAIFPQPAHWEDV